VQLTQTPAIVLGFWQQDRVATAQLDEELVPLVMPSCLLTADGTAI
jgi:hypothetical protein